MNTLLTGHRTSAVALMTATLLTLSLAPATAESLVATADAATQTADQPPSIEDGFGLTVVSEPSWVDETQRTFTFSVAAEQVPTPTLLPGQKPGEHAITVTLPEDYDPGGARRYPVLYSLHGYGDRPDNPVNQLLAERSTEGTPLITVQPNGGRSWYANWLNPRELGPQNWQDFHLDGVLPLIDANLPTDATKQGRAIIGHSMGGFGAFRYARQRPELFSAVGSMSGGLDLLDQEQRAAVVASLVTSVGGLPTASADSIFGLPIWPVDEVWNAESPAQHVAELRGMDIAMYVGNGGNLTVDPVQAIVENRARETNLVTAANLTAAGIPFEFVDYGDGSDWAPGCTGKHAQVSCLQADLDHFVESVLHHRPGSR
ncbi:alpha/beta hydrolase [Actinoalloteichus hymeniacidonis]|uniref:Esterase n=1 Tax=Actinoalloteichus hymeniacidonis TaxID=340345 RepID=A0AAC9MZ87_9PSEU|nr:alpha/beta fold hydrolase [Actinoalloteichus hymeniacidonis]AOS64095.1 putative esterase [Actinoalloteichus hymeniacidonis]MBB5907841.1 S-formylglutathione hydrolase FrmB [Actinoalloteichus hymeniacidonis]